MSDDTPISSSNVSKARILTQNDGVPGSKFEQDPENYTNTQLKRWLKCRGLKLSGKRADLISRVRDCLKSGNHYVLDSSIDEGKWLQAKILKENNINRIHLKDLTVPQTPKSGWRVFPSQDIPSLFNYGHVYHYTLESLPVVEENIGSTEDEENQQDTGLGHMTDKPFTVGRKYTDSGFVHDLSDNKTHEHYFVRAHVWPSMQSDFPHNVNIILSRKSGAVIHASCSPCKTSELGRCSHVVAVLLTLVDHVNNHGAKTTTPCTSKECTWNKGQKRKKNPQKLSDATYPSKKRKNNIQVIDFDPRPKEFRRVTSKNINKFVVDLQALSSDQKDVSMWETQLLITYEDYAIEASSVPLLEEKGKLLLTNITPKDLWEIEGTVQQSQSDKWRSERWLRITASTCLDAYKVGKSVLTNSSNAASSCKKFIKKHIWKLDGDTPQTSWMKYGLESESAAVKQYEIQTSLSVSPTGLWVNPQFSYIACSPDGLVGDHGLLEIKSLKIFHDNTIDQVVNDTDRVLVSKDTLNRQCFVKTDNKCILKKSHDYYYQIQCQLLVTEREFCDFVLYAKDGPISVQRIYRDQQLICDILLRLSALWKRVIAPEIIEMRVPRDLKPFVMSSSFLTVAPHNANVSHGNSDEFDLSNDDIAGVSHGNSDEFDLSNDDIANVSHGNGNEFDISNGDSDYVSHDNGDHCSGVSNLSGYTTDEINKAVLLTTCASSYHSTENNLLSDCNFIVIPWSGITSDGIKLVNTCPIDNWLMIFQSLAKSGRLNLHNLNQAGELINVALQLIDLNKFADAKILFVQNPDVVNGVIDCYGNEADYCIRVLLPFLATSLMSSCDQVACPSKTEMYKSHSISLGCDNNKASFHSSLSEWLHSQTTTCQRKFSSKPSSDTPCQSDQTQNCDGTTSVSWHCAGIRTTYQRTFHCFKNFAIFSVDLLSRRCKLQISDLPASIILNGQQLTLHSGTLWNGHHYICFFRHNNTWFVYDGLKEYNQKNSGLSVFSVLPKGYYLSHVLFIV